MLVYFAELSLSQIFKTNSYALMVHWTDCLLRYTLKLLNKCLIKQVFNHYLNHMTLSEKEIQQNRQILSETDERMATTFKVLSVVNRYRIFRILVEQPKISVSTIAEILNISLPLASQHIKILVQANLIQKRREGKKVFPKIAQDNPFVPAILKTIKQAYKLRVK